MRPTVADAMALLKKIGELTGPCIERKPECIHTVCCYVREAREMSQALERGVRDAR